MNRQIVKQKNRPHGIMFHHFHDDKKHPKGQGSITDIQFEKMIIFLKKNHNILSSHTWYDKAVSMSLDPNDICITFDDNLLCQYEIALPILDKYNIKAFWFVYTSPLQGENERLEIYRYYRSVFFNNIDDFYLAFNESIEKSKYKLLVENGLKKLNIKTYLKSYPFYSVGDKIFRYIRDVILGADMYNEIMELMIATSKMDIEKVSCLLWNNAEGIKNLHDQGHIIGLHSHSHPTTLGNLSYDSQLKEYQNNINILKSILGKEILIMSHPCNSYNEDTIKILKSMNVNFGFRANMDYGYNIALEYPRLDSALLINQIQES